MQKSIIIYNNVVLLSMMSMKTFIKKWMSLTSIKFIYKFSPKEYIMK